VREEEHVTGLSKAAATKKRAHKRVRFAGWVDDCYTSEGAVASLMKANETAKESRRVEVDWSEETV